jgi:hypothetical protein
MGQRAILKVVQRAEPAFSAHTDSDRRSVIGAPNVPISRTKSPKRRWRTLSAMRLSPLIDAGIFFKSAAK